MPFKCSQLKQIDLFGRRAELSMNGQKSHKTWCGTFCTLFIFIACTISSIYYASEFFRRSNPQYIYSEVYDSIYDVNQDEVTVVPFKEIRIGSLNFFAMMGIQNTEYNLNDYYIEFTIYSREEVIAKFQGVNCSDTDYFEEILENKEINTKSNFKLFKEHPEKFVCLGGQKSELLPFVYEEQSRVEVRLKCLDAISCQKLTGQKLIVLSADYLLVPQDFYNPLALYIMDHYINIDHRYLTIIDVQLQKVRINTDYGYIIENNRYFEQVTFRDFKRYNQLRDPTSVTEPLVLINIIPYSKRQIYDRTYPKVITLIGIVGGLLKSLMVLGHFSTKPFSKISMRTDLVNQLFTFEIFSEKKYPNVHEKGQGDEVEDEGEDEEGNKKFVPRSKSMTFSKQKQGEKNQKLLKLKTSFKADDQQPISVDQLKLQIPNSEQSVNQKTTCGTNNILYTNNNLETPNNIIPTNSSNNKYKSQYFEYPLNASPQENLSFNQYTSTTVNDRQLNNNIQAEEQFYRQSPALRYNSASSEIQSDDQYSNSNHQSAYGNFNRDFYSNNNNFNIQQRQQIDKQVRNIRFSGKFNGILGQKKESIILHDHDSQQQQEDYGNNQNQVKQTRFGTMNTIENGRQQTQISSNTQESPPQQSPPNMGYPMYPVYPNQLDFENNTERNNISVSTRSSLKKGGMIKTFKHSQSHSDDNKSTYVDIQRELEEKNLMQRRNANFDREKKGFVKKETNKNLAQDQQSTSDLDKSIKKQPSFKQQITKKVTLQKKDSFKKKETLRQSDKSEQSQNQNEGEQQTQSTSRRIKSFFSARTKEITNLIRLNIQQRQQQSKDQQENKGQNQGEQNNSNQDTEQKTEENKPNKQENSSLTKQNTHKQFEGIINDKQDKSMILTMVDYVKYFIKCFKDTPKVKQMKYTNKKVKNRLDIIYILEKLIEIDKLKVLLLNPDQINLFDYMPKEFVSSDLNDYDNYEFYNKNNKFATWSLLCAERSQLDKYSNACIAYHHIQQNINKTKIDKKLIQMLDPQVKRYFTKTFIQPEEINNYRNLLANYSLSEDELSDQLNNNNLMSQKQRESQQQSFDLNHHQLNQQNLYQSQQIQQNLLASQQLHQNYLNLGQSQQLSSNYYNLGSSAQMSHMQSSISPINSYNDRSRSSLQLGYDQQNMQRYSNGQFLSPQRMVPDMNQDRIQSLYLPERINNDRKMSSLSQQTIFTNSPQLEVVKNSPLQSNQSDADTLAMSILKNKRSTYISQKSKMNTFTKEYCWQAPIIEESNNMLSSEKFGAHSNSSPKNFPKEQVSPSLQLQLEEKKSQLFFSRHQSIILKTDENNNQKTNTANNSINLQQVPMQTEGDEILQTEPAVVTDRLNDDVIRFENSENSSFNQAELYNQIDSLQKNNGEDHYQIKLSTQMSNAQQLFTAEDEIQNELNNITHQQSQNY